MEHPYTATIKNMFDAAVSDFPAELGRQLQQYLEKHAFPPQSLENTLSAVGVPMDASDLARLEAGNWTGSIDVRLLIALAFAADFSTDKVIVACLTRAGQAAEEAEAAESGE